MPENKYELKMALKRKEKMTVITLIFDKKFAALWLYLSVTYINKSYC
jgi:hypothetical protein